ncbi:MAG: alpha/beta hydrolase [Fibrobacter sp.]|nr:alpha/beta hydrolase [Fibrobacter sp.]
MSQTSEKYRVEWLAADQARDAGLEEPADVVAFKDIPYGTYDSWNLLDLYMPKDATKYTNVNDVVKGAANDAAQKLPVIISIHGGAFVYGQKETYKFYLMSLAQRGFACVNFNYRLAPEYKFPAALEDTDAVLHWVMDNADKHNLDTENIFMVGDSAGANYAALYSIYCVNPEYARKVQDAAKFWYGKQARINPPLAFKPRAVALNCGLYDVTNDRDNHADIMVDLFGEHLEECCEYLNVMDNLTADFPPAFVMTGEYDFLKLQNRHIAKALSKLNLPHVFKSYGTPETKEISHVFHVNMKLPLAHLCNDEECEFFKGKL